MNWFFGLFFPICPSTYSQGGHWLSLNEYSFLFDDKTIIVSKYFYQRNNENLWVLEYFDSREIEQLELISGYIRLD